jgi:hypothetical protein
MAGVFLKNVANTQPRNITTMDRDQLNVTDMGSTVSSYMARNKTLWGGVKAITDTVADVDSTLAAIGEKDKKQQTPTGGAAGEKTSVRNDFEDQIVLIADQLGSLAAATDDLNLEAQAHLTLPGLDKLAAEDLEATGKRISELATANLAALADHNITQQDVKELDDLTVAFHGVKTAPRNAVVDRKKQTDTLPGLISSLRSILRRRLDRQMTAFKRKQPEFYAGYVAARVIVDRGGSSPDAKPDPTPTPPVTPTTPAK